MTWSQVVPCAMGGTGPGLERTLGVEGLDGFTCTCVVWGLLLGAAIGCPPPHVRYPRAGCSTASQGSVNSKGDQESSSQRPLQATEPPCSAFNRDSNFLTIALERSHDSRHQSLHSKFLLFFQRECLFGRELCMSGQKEAGYPLDLQCSLSFMAHVAQRASVERDSPSLLLEFEDATFQAHQCFAGGVCHADGDPFPGPFGAGQGWVAAQLGGI